MVGVEQKKFINYFYFFQYFMYFFFDMGNVDLNKKDKYY